MCSLHAMPILVVNMGAEMVFVLQQRLQAQNIPATKTQTVLSDVLRTMYNPVFINELFRQHAAYTHKATRQIFERLAHSSIMRLNTTSMEKLYDLMSMGFKYQVVNCHSANQVLEVTRQHIDQLCEIGNESCQHLIQSVWNRIESLYGAMTQGALMMLHQTILRVCQDRKVKISLLLQSKEQNTNGSFRLSMNGKCPEGVKVPGVVRNVQADEFADVQLCVTKLFNVENGPPDEGKLGLNMYLNIPSKSVATTTPPTTDVGEAESKGSDVEDESKTGPTPTPSRPDPKESGTNEELNFLADLIATTPASSEHTFKLNLFHDDDEDEDMFETGAPKEDECVLVSIDGKSERKSRDERLEELGWGANAEDGVDTTKARARRRQIAGASKTADSDDEQEEEEEGEDLLELMDQFASSKTDD